MAYSATWLSGRSVYLPPRKDFDRWLISCFVVGQATPAGVLASREAPAPKKRTAFPYLT